MLRALGCGQVGTGKSQNAMGLTKGVKKLGFPCLVLWSAWSLSLFRAKKVRKREQLQGKLLRLERREPSESGQRWLLVTMDRLSQPRELHGGKGR